MSRSTRNPSNWDEYQYGTSHRSSLSSATSRSVKFSEDHERGASPASDLLDVPNDELHGLPGGNLRKRRSSVAMHFNAISHIGGVNSIENFARSWQRAASFLEVTPNPPTLLLSAENEDYTESTRYGRGDVETARMPYSSLLRQQLTGSTPVENVADDDEDVMGPRKSSQVDVGQSGMSSDRLSTQDSIRHSTQESIRDSQSIFNIAPHIATPLAGSYGTSYGTLHSTLNESSMVHAGQLWLQQQASGATHPDGERAPLLVKEVEQDGKLVYVIEGQSTLPQTIFNATNVLIGVGLLSLPLGIRYAGWLCGMIFLLFSALVTSYTAKLLSKCMDVDGSLITFADLAFVSYGQNARIATSILFTLELLAACVALVVLFADTLDILIPGIGVDEWKILCGILLIPLNFVPLRLLSFSSILGIFSCFSIVLIIFIDGILKPHTPGSLREPAETYLFPSNWLTLPLSFGLLMSPWGGHSVFPNIYRDMRHPHKFGKAVKTTFAFTYVLDAATALAGLLMFGDGVMDEVTSNIIGTSGYPRALSAMLTIFIAIIPLTKLPLNARPIVSTIEVFCGLDTRAVSDNEALLGLSAWARGLLKVIIRIVVIVIFVIIAILCPAFDSIMAFMGSGLCFAICVILPCMFHLRIFGKEIGVKEKLLNYFLIVICSILAIVGTVFAFLPKSLIGAE
ncbi:MAG: hypothetical protein M1818_000179 [Claussenomyces sp. TS43310]|nr:MAG: hypothetical protein M1818_000179 [Claussenomyces sp. TS43310]